MVVYFIAGEILVYLVFKCLRRDFIYLIRLEGPVAFLLALFIRVAVKVMTDYCGFVHGRSPLEMGGVAWAASMLWAQLLPFVALGIYDRDSTNKGELTVFLICSFASWVVLNFFFYCSIDPEYLST